ncbi:IS3 family transposase [Actinomyces bowdenii]|uniref:Transposase n=1 Tax=Actinomyces bowdenii TaxID=131109 RepID=A0A3P1UNN7_9ACTO|nr:IS3 family transposase [Actinomyces bowdenii]RRD23351.1 transposase [Actinomyces bowdenii]
MSQKYELINREEGNYPISSMCHWSKVSRSGYYSWKDRPQSRKYIRRQELVSMIETEFKSSDGTYGYRRITARLARRGVSVHRDTVRCLMRQAGLVAAQPRRLRTWRPGPT